MNIAAMLLLSVQLAGYAWLGWVNWFSSYDRHIPVPAMAAYAVAALNTLLIVVDVVLWLASKSRLMTFMWPIVAALPAILIAGWYFLRK